MTVRIEREHVDKKLLQQCLDELWQPHLDLTSAEEFMSGTDGSVETGCCAVCDLYLAKMPK